MSPSKSRLQLPLVAVLALLIAWIAPFAPLAPRAVARVLLASEVVVDHVHAVLREGPASDTAKLRSLANGERLTLLQTQSDGGYLKVRTAAGEVGWVYKRWVVAAQPIEPPEFDEKPAADEMRIHCIDVGQGAATLFEFSCGAILVDTGGEDTVAFDGSAALTSYLEGFFARRDDLGRTLDLVVLTHPHPDHTLGVTAVLQHYFVENAVDDGVRSGKGFPSQRALEEHMNAEAPGHLRQIDAQACVDAHGLTDSVIDPLDCSGSDPRIRILWGGVNEAMKTRLHWSKTEFEEENNHSVVVRVDFGKASMLITGDLEEQAIGDLIAAYSGTALLDVDIWEVGHHGSANGTTDPFLAAMSPAMAVVCVGNSARQAKWTAWDYGHPRDSVIWMIEQRVTGFRTPVSASFATAKSTFAPPREISKAIFGTGWDGTVVVSARKNGEIRVGDDVIVAAH